MVATGPSIRAICRMLNQGSCGSGTIVGVDADGFAYIMSNAHVVGSRIGRRIIVEVEATGDRIYGRVIAAGYSSRTWTDWAIVKSEEPYTKVHPVPMSKNGPSGSHYTKGFPRCRPHNGTDIRTIRIQNNGVWTWLPDAISGQSGSGIFDDDDGYQYGLLTWSIGRHGGGQTTEQIYRQARTKSLDGAPRVEGMVELDEYDMEGIDTEDMDDPIVEDGLNVQRSVDITKLPIWAEDNPVDPPADPTDPPCDVSANQIRKIRINAIRKQIESLQDESNALQGLSPPTAVEDSDGNKTYGL